MCVDTLMSYCGDELSQKKDKTHPVFAIIRPIFYGNQKKTHQKRDVFANGRMGCLIFDLSMRLNTGGTEL